MVVVLQLKFGTPQTLVVDMLLSLLYMSAPVLSILVSLASMLWLITSVQSTNVHMEDFVHEYYSVERFKAAYKRLIEPLPDRSQWPDADLPFGVRAPLDKRTAGRYRKLRIKSFLEGGGSKGKKAAKETANEAEKGKKKMIRGKRKCNGCGELGHGKTSYKCHLNGTKKRKRKPRKNTTKYGENAKIPTKRAKKGGKSQDTATEPATPNAFHDQEMAPPALDDLHALEIEAPAPVASLHDQGMPTPAPNTLTSPTRLTRDQIIQNSPNRVTRGQLQNLLVEGVSPDKTVQKRSPPKKLKPRKLKTN